MQISKNTVIIQEYPIAIDHITVVLILNNLQYSIKVVKFGILSQFACANVTKLEFIYGILHPINHHYNHQLFSPGPRDWFKRVM